VTRHSLVVVDRPEEIGDLFLLYASEVLRVPALQKITGFAVGGRIAAAESL
jgi:hypothetical protein